MGEVWRANHVVTGRDVALKLLNRALSERLEMRLRFLREARAVGKMNHPNVIEVLDAFEDDGRLALVMPLLKGEVLGQFLRRHGPLSVASALQIFLPLVSAVDAAHAQGIVHRDLKPDNVFLVSQAGRRHVKVLDFGIAKLMNPATADGASLTATGNAIGTLWYMAPEQCLGDSTQDHLVDVWALGVILYELLSGRRPIEGQNLAQVIKASLLEPIPPLERLVPGLPRGISELAAQMLSHERSARPQTLREVHERLLEHAPAVQQRHWQRVERDRAQSADDPLPGGEEQTLGSATTVRFNPTDHAMLSSVRPPARSWSRQAWLGAVLVAAASLVFATVKRAPRLEESAAPVAATSPSPSLVGQPPDQVEPAKPRGKEASLAAPIATGSTVRIPRPVAKAAPRATGPFSSPLAPPTASAVASAPVRATAEVAPRPLDTANPFSLSRPSAAKRSFAH
jgi:serine/threonine-protein kinase